MSDRFEPKKSLGQHFLNSDYVPKKLCDAADVNVGERVLEIGPGTGMLTKELLKRGANVIALEADRRAIIELEETFLCEITSGQLTVIHHDVRTLDPAMFGLAPGNYKVVANIPYYLSGFLFRTLLESAAPPSTLVFLVQKEVATRIARDKKESLLSLSIKLFGTPTYICTIAKSHFTPPPRIDSAIIAVREIKANRYTGLNYQGFFEILHLGFGSKRKQLASNLSAKFDKTQVVHKLSDLGLTATVRAEDISLSNWVQLAIHLQSPD